MLCSNLVNPCVHAVKAQGGGPIPLILAQRHLSSGTEDTCDSCLFKASNCVSAWTPLFWHCISAQGSCRRVMSGDCGGVYRPTGASTCGSLAYCRMNSWQTACLLLSFANGSYVMLQWCLRWSNTVCSCRNCLHQLSRLCLLPLLQESWKFFNILIAGKDMFTIIFRGFFSFLRCVNLH